jgi:hypothetical protein
MILYKLFIFACLVYPVEDHGYNTECRALTFEVKAINQSDCEGIVPGTIPRKAIIVQSKCSRYFES